MTINKSRQTLPFVGIYLRDHCFANGQLYVALSRVIRREEIKIFVENGTFDRYQGVYTSNPVFRRFVEDS